MTAMLILVLLHLIRDSIGLRNTYNFVNSIGKNNLISSSNNYNVKITKNNFPKLRYSKIQNITMIVIT